MLNNIYINIVRCIKIIPCIILCLLSSCTMQPKRGEAPTVVPLIYNGIEYKAPSAVEKEGILEAWDVKTKEKLWEKRIYSYFKNPFFETDVQWVFIKKMTFDKLKKNIIITNEKGDVFLINLITRKVTKEQPTPATNPTNPQTP